MDGPRSSSKDLVGPCRKRGAVSPDADTEANLKFGQPRPGALVPGPEDLGVRQYSCFQNQMIGSSADSGLAPILFKRNGSTTCSKIIGGMQIMGAVSTRSSSKSIKAFPIRSETANNSDDTRDPLQDTKRPGSDRVTSWFWRQKKLEVGSWQRQCGC